MDPLLIGQVLRLRWLLAQRDGWSRTQLRSFQDAALGAMRDFAYARSPFYRKHHAGLERRPLSELPPVTKAHVMEQFDELATDPAIRLADVRAHVASLSGDERYLGRYRVAATSGSTGAPGLFLWDSTEWATVLASYARAMDWAGVGPALIRRLRLALVSSTRPSYQSARVGLTAESPFVLPLRLDSVRPLSEIVERLNGFAPDVLVAYASMAELLAEEQVSRRLDIAPRAVFSSSEVLPEAARRRIEAAWGCSPFNVYAATETAGIASECERHAGLHCYEDLVITEVVDERNRPVPPGEYGAKVLVTVLFGRTQPLIRYEMSDSVRLADRACGCGRPFALVDEIQGRREDTMMLPSLDGGVVRVHPNLFHDVLGSAPVARWQVIQESDALRVLVQGPRGAFEHDALTAALTRAITALGARAPPVRIEVVGSIPKTTIGKTPLVKALSPPQDGAPASPRS